MILLIIFIYVLHVKSIKGTFIHFFKQPRKIDFTVFVVTLFAIKI